MHAAPQLLRLVTHAPTRPAPSIKRPTMSPDDVRWVLALRVRESLQGGSAAILPPESRSRINLLGRRLGLRPFDVSLIIAIVQDDVRVGRGRVAGVSNDGVSRLTMVPGTAGSTGDVETQSGAWWAAWIGATVLLGAAMAATAVMWLLV